MIAIRVTSLISAPLRIGALVASGLAFAAILLLGAVEEARVRWRLP